MVEIVDYSMADPPDIPYSQHGPDDLHFLDLEALASDDDEIVQAEILAANRHIGPIAVDQDLLLSVVLKRLENALSKTTALDSKGIFDVVSLLCSDLRSYGHSMIPLYRKIIYETAGLYGFLRFRLALLKEVNLEHIILRLDDQHHCTLATQVGRIPPQNMTEYLLECNLWSDFELVSRSWHAESPESTTSSSFQYFSLTGIKLESSYDFRLVLLDCELTGSEVDCLLFPARFKDRYRYEALSYTWGDVSGETRTVNINTRPFDITVNLFKALEALRRNSNGGRYRLLWIDSVCIDQGNVEDRNKQVSKMGQIYKAAQRVVIWLGGHRDNSELAMDFIEKVCSPSPSLSFKSIFTESEEAAGMEAIQFLFCREYWTRTWIIQEIQLARDITVYCGDRVSSWRSAVLLYERLHAALSHTSRELAVLNSPAIQLMETAQLHHKRGMTLKQLLYRHEKSECRERRDKIYGLLALASDCQNCEIHPDYSRHIGRVYLDALKLELATSWNAATNDLVYYSYFLKKTLQLYVPATVPSPMKCINKDYCVEVVGFSCGVLKEHKDQESNHGISSAVFTINDYYFKALKGSQKHVAEEVQWLGPGFHKTYNIIAKTQPKAMVLSRLGLTVHVPQATQPNDEICMFSKVDSALVIRKPAFEGGSWTLVGTACVLITEEKKRKRPRAELRHFQYCLPDYDIFPPPTANINQRMIMRLSVDTLRFITRVYGKGCSTTK